ncbi:alginate export family protein [Aurantiacibacter xanthus]|nr:alginate export family protein [Aurantiacibacter xanthus]
MWPLLPLAAAVIATPATQPATPPPQDQPATTRASVQPVVTPYPSAAAGNGSTVDGYSLSRWAEDWSALCHADEQGDPIDRLKCISFDPDHRTYLTLSGEVRLRVNHTTNPNLRDAPAQRQDIRRLVAGADLHLGPNLRVFGEIAHGGISGVNLGAPPATLRNEIAVQQLFVEGDADVGGVDVGLRYGRQEFTDGPGLLVSQRDNNTIRYTLNGWRAWARGSKVRIDLFDFRPTQYGDLSAADDEPDPERRFSGITAGIVLPERWFGGSRLYLDPFLWRRRNRVGTWGGRVGPATRHFLGARLWGTAGRLTMDWTVNRQWGRFMEQDIDAWQVFLAQTWRVAPARSAPTVGIHLDYASGGGGYGEGNLRNAYTPFGSNIYYSYGLFLMPSNLIAVSPNVTLSPVKRLRLTAEYELAWRATVHDAVYRANGQPFAGTQDVAQARVGNLARLQAVWTITPRLTMTGRYEHFAAGPALTQAGYRSSDFMATWLSFRF